MRKKRNIVIVSIILAVLLLVIGAYAYYEYYGKYSALIQVNGVIMLDAFGALDDEYRGTENGYGITPENPFIVDSKERMNNLVVLNNSGRLLDAKGVYGGADKFYFAFDFTEQPVPQVLNLTGITQSPIGSNQFPFIDDLTGLLYAYLVSESEYVYMSAGASVDIEVVGADVTIDGQLVTLSSGTAFASEYVKVPSFYYSTYTAIATNPQLIITSDNNYYIPINALLPAPQIVSNVTVKPPNNQIDVGFFGCIGREYGLTEGGIDENNIVSRSFVHDVILYNVTIDCTETQPNIIKAALDSIWSSILNTVPRHIFADTETQSDRRHIGLFAGHIDGMAENITVAGQGIIRVNGADVNTYSRFTTVGYIDDRAIINGVQFSELIGAGTGMGLLSQPLFADSIYDLASIQPDVYEYPLSSIPGQSGIWSGISTTVSGLQNINHFSQGIFRFMLSKENDTVSTIWQGRGNVNLLNETGFNVTQSVLYCSDEYRYSETPQGGGSLVSTGASSNETRYAGISPLSASSSILDKGKYIIVAKVFDNIQAKFRYYAVKIIAVIGQDGTIDYVFDDSEKVEVTDYINGTSTEGIYSSCIWQTASDTQMPTFQNTRFKSQYLSVQQGSSLDMILTEDSNNAAAFRASVLNNTFTYSVTEQVGAGYVTTRYYLNFNTSTSTFYFSTANDTTIEIYQISNGFNLELVDDISDISANDDYIITAQYGGSSYLIGTGTSEGVGGTLVVDGTFSSDLSLSSIPDNWNINEYQALKRYIWNAPNVSTGTVAFREKLSGTYYLGYSGSTLALTQQQSMWTYTQNTGAGGTLGIISSYLTYIYNPGGSGFTLAVNPYTVYIYKLVPDDTEPDYNTYQGAKLVSSDSSIVQQGQYMIAVNTGTSYQAVIMTAANTLGIADISQYANGTATFAQLQLLLEGAANEGYKWKVNATSSVPSLQNMKYSSYLSNSTNTQLALSASEVQWMYDAVSGRLYYTSSDVLYYLAYNGTSFVITSDTENATLIYDIRLYKVTYEYEYTDVVPVQSISYTDATYIDLTYVGENKFYFILTAPLTDMANTAPYILGSYGTVDQAPIESLNIAPTSTYNSINSIFTTTSDLSYYRWRMDTRMVDATTVYECGYQFRNDITNMYLGASNNPSSRTLVMVATSNINLNRTSNNPSLENNADTASPTGIGLGATTLSRSPGPLYRTDGSGNYIGNSFYIMGRRSPYEYYVWKTPSPGVFALALNNSSSAAPSEYSLPYLYEASGYTTNVIISEISEIGDNLDPDMHYMITAQVDNLDTTFSYYALSETLDELSSKVLTGTNVTSQASAINNSNILDEFGQIAEESSTDMLIMVPVEADWYQTSINKSLFFYQDYYSTNAIKDWLTASGATIGITSINVNVSTQPSTQWYYDAISKYMFYSDGIDKYYLTYDVLTDVFSLTTDRSSATHTYIYRFKPTYVVSKVENAADDSLKDGDFIIAGRDAEGYTALGISDSGLSLEARNISEYIKETLTETERNEILQFIWKQQYYDFYSTPYDPLSNTQYMQLFSYITGGGFTVIYDTSTSGMDLSSDPMIWRITNNNGVWSFINNRLNGSVAANTRAIRFVGDTSRLTIADTAKTVERYVASGLSYLFSTAGYPVILCDTNGNPVVSPVLGAQYLVLARSSNVNYSAVKNNAGTITLVNYTSTTYQDSGCLWTASENVGGWTLINGGRYISAIAGGSITSSTTANGTWSISGTGQMSYSTYNFPYYTSTTSIGMTTNTGTYTSRLYNYTYSGGVGTLIPTTAAGTNKVLVFRTGTTTYRALIINNNSFAYTTLSGVVEQTNGTITTTTNLIGTNAILTAIQSGTGITLRNSGGRYLTTNGTTFGRSTTAGTTFYLDSKGYFYYSQGTIYTPAIAPAYNTSSAAGITVYMYEHNSGVYTPVTGGLTAGKTYVMLVYDESVYYLIGQNNSVITRTYIGSTLPSGWESSINPNFHHISAVAGPVGNYLVFSTISGFSHLTISNNLFMLTGSQTTQWEYSYSGQYGSDSRLYSVVITNLTAAHLTVGATNRIETTLTQMDVILYQATDQGDGTYTLTSKITSGVPVSGTYVIVIFKDGIYFAVRYSSSGIIGYNLGSSVLDERIIADLVWKADASGFKKDVGGQIYYLRRNTEGLYAGTSAGATWSYTYTNVTAAFFATNTTSTPLYIFRVDKSSELDDVTDTISMLSGKARITQSVSLLESSNYVIIAEVDEDNDSIVDRYYSLSMNDIYNTKPIDVTAIMNLSLGLSSSYINLFDASVWVNKGTDIEVILKNRGFTDAYYLTGAQGNLTDMTPQIELIDEQAVLDLTDYKWRIYTYTIGSENVYLFGYEDTSTGVNTIFYMYFDPADLTFKLTSDYTTAASTQGRVQLYQLAAMTPTQPIFHSYVIEVAEDNQTILSYPVKLVESQDDLYMYSQTEVEGQIMRTGEYLISAVIGDHYYTLTLSELLNLSYVDVNPYFSGNFSIDTNGDYCVSVNSEYIWKQISDPSTVLNFESTAYSGYYLSASNANFMYDIENRQLSNGTSFLAFDLDNGFYLSTTASSVPINLYLLGQVGVETGLPGGDLSYNYFTQPLTTIGGAVDFTKFSFTKTLIPDLKRYGVGYDGTIGSVDGWTLYNAEQILSTADSSVFFSEGVISTSDVAIMKEEFIPMNHTTEFDGATVDIQYYAPAGSASFVIDEASQENPVFVNVIVSTEFDNILLNPEYLRYLALWRIADIDLLSGAATTLKTYGDGSDEEGNYAYTFINKRNTPYAAIPLPNRYGSTASGASFARVDGIDYTLSDVIYGEDYFIAHTYVITDPGVYYLGASYGSVAFTYLAVDNRALTEEGETSGLGFENQFTIDFCYGDIASSVSGAVPNEAIGTVVYVGHDDWYQSNIYPQFIKGTALNPTDYLRIEVNRTYNSVDDTSSVNFRSYTAASIAPGILHINDNTAAQRLTQKVDFRVYCNGLDSTSFTGVNDRLWVCDIDEDEHVTFSTTHVIGDVEGKYYINVSQYAIGTVLLADKPVLTTTNKYKWNVVGGYLTTLDGRYLIKTSSGYSLSTSPTNAVGIYSYDGTLNLVTSPVNGTPYLLIANDGTGNTCITINFNQ